MDASKIGAVPEIRYYVVNILSQSSAFLEGDLFLRKPLLPQTQVKTENGLGATYRKAKHENTLCIFAIY